jgi:hypothetical protein
LLSWYCSMYNQNILEKIVLIYKCISVPFMNKMQMCVCISY